MSTMNAIVADRIVNGYWNNGYFPGSRTRALEREADRLGARGLEDEVRFAGIEGTLITAREKGGDA